MASASPALHATRPSGWVDLRRPAEYPIVLGDSLKAGVDSQEHLLNLRYNWQPKAGFADRQSRLTKRDKGYRLVVKDEDSSKADAFIYSGFARPVHSDTQDDKSRSLALVFDKKKSRFVLEAISSSLDLNLISAPGQASEDVRGFPQLSPSYEGLERSIEMNGEGTKSMTDDDTPDPTNPFDFRNFLSEAKENVERNAQPGGGRTPIPGSRTPLSGFGSPIPGASRFLSTTPQFRPAPTSAPVQKKKPEESKRGHKLDSPAKQKSNPMERKTTKQAHQPLSKERISDSDEEISDTITLAQHSPAYQAKPKPRGHSRQISSGFGRSPHIVVNDGDLEIDMGSPPQDAVRRRGRVDPGAFRSHTGTPVAGWSTYNARRAVDEDVIMKDRDDDAEAVEDDDVEELELGSPRRGRVSLPSSTVIPEQEQAPTPTNQAAPNDEDDDEDFLAAQLEAALEEEDNENEAASRGATGVGMGLGISGATSRVEDDESEISEEE